MTIAGLFRAIQITSLNSTSTILCNSSKNLTSASKNLSGQSKWPNTSFCMTTRRHLQKMKLCKQWLVIVSAQNMRMFLTIKHLETAISSHSANLPSISLSLAGSSPQSRLYRTRISAAKVLTIKRSRSATTFSRSHPQILKSRSSSRPRMPIPQRSRKVAGVQSENARQKATQDGSFRWLSLSSQLSLRHLRHLRNPAEKAHKNSTSTWLFQVDIIIIPRLIYSSTISRKTRGAERVPCMCLALTTRAALSELRSTSSVV